MKIVKERRANDMADFLVKFVQHEHSPIIILIIVKKKTTFYFIKSLRYKVKIFNLLERHLKVFKVLKVCCKESDFSKLMVYLSLKIINSDRKLIKSDERRK